MKRIFVGTLLALPLIIGSLPSQASAAEIIVRPGVQRHNVVSRYVVHKKLIRGHWERTRSGRRWVPAHYVRV
ncbi:hypothetical protein CDG77_05010 [Nostoc sp. 'Peltigera membranacea cyanobiont' 213]|uniref:hypothetical protein n=1 Tax=unclassified Nostoc TaxID=2593658 RepID=UPI000B954818|nr:MULTISPECIES: hypothetical protein [unclassified Nostoc]AVH67877.1 hypothetical protein NPM_6496 [Nostoc sp. 'Peltigera membranacea cyanobiont' N6]OYD98644.1 hypothetical protein CDG77_05010 [Nostoc sp. 'Peltigera membranacea cyanobiont' 213]